MVKAVLAMYEGAQTVVTTTKGDSKAFNVKVGLHQGSVFESHTVCDSNGNDFQRATTGLPLELLYADDLIVVAESEECLHDKIVNGNQRWKQKV